MKHRILCCILCSALITVSVIPAFAISETDAEYIITDPATAITTTPACTEEDPENSLDEAEKEENDSDLPNTGACSHIFETWDRTASPTTDASGRMIGVCSQCGLTEIRTFQTEMQMTLGQNTYSLNQTMLEMDAAPRIRNARTMLPVRYVAEALGSTVEWDESLSTATLTTDTVTIAITVGADSALVNGESIPLDVPAFIEDERTYMPVRFVAEHLGGTVTWNGSTSTATITDAGEPIGRILDAPYLYQVKDYPNGCESVSTVMALQYLGMDIDTETFIESYLDMGAAPVIDGIGPDPELVYCGNPRSQAGWGCYASVIAKALDKYIDKNLYNVSLLYGKSPEDLCSEYLDRNLPVILWATVEMENSSASEYYAYWKTPEGKQIAYNMWLHCLLLVGYDENNYYFNDPLHQNADGTKYTAYSKASVENAYRLLHEQCVVITPTGSTTK